MGMYYPRQASGITFDVHEHGVEDDRFRNLNRELNRHQDRHDRVCDVMTSISASQPAA